MTLGVVGLLFVAVVVLLLQAKGQRKINRILHARTAAHDLQLVELERSVQEARRVLAPPPNASDGPNGISDTIAPPSPPSPARRPPYTGPERRVTSEDIAPPSPPSPARRPPYTGPERRRVPDLRATQVTPRLVEPAIPTTPLPGAGNAR